MKIVYHTVHFRIDIVFGYTMQIEEMEQHPAFAGVGQRIFERLHTTRQLYLSCRRYRLVFRKNHSGWNDLSQDEYSNVDTGFCDNVWLIRTTIRVPLPSSQETILHRIVRRVVEKIVVPKSDQSD